MSGSDSRLRAFIVSKLEGDWEEAVRDPKEAVSSLGWEDRRIDESKLDSALDRTFTSSVDSMYFQMKNELVKHGLTEEQGLDLLLWELAGTLRDSKLEKHEDVATSLGNILSDDGANYIAEALLASQTLLVSQREKSRKVPRDKMRRL